ncbi:MAG: hypothetical protein ACLVGL_12355 [Waltera sp.]
MVKDAQYYISLLCFGVSFADILVDGTERREECRKQIVFLYSSYGMILCRKRRQMSFGGGADLSVFLS